MASKGRVKVGIIGSQFEADIHADSFRIMPDEGEVVAVASPTPGNAEKLAKKYDIPRVFTDYRQMLAQNDIIMIPTDPLKKFFDDLDNLIKRGVNTGVNVTYDAGTEMGIPTGGQ